MRVRRLYNDSDGSRSVVWFGSAGTNEDGTAKFVNANDKHDNFASDEQQVVDSLTQYLSVINHELWYHYQYGMPLVGSGPRVMIDGFVMSTIQNHQDVYEITSFSSNINGHKYSCQVQFRTRFGLQSLSL